MHPSWFVFVTLCVPGVSAVRFCSEVKNINRYSFLAVGLMAIENLFRYPALAVGLMEIAN